MNPIKTKLKTEYIKTNYEKPEPTQKPFTAPSIPVQVSKKNPELQSFLEAIKETLREKNWKEHLSSLNQKLGELRKKHHSLPQGSPEQKAVYQKMKKTLDRFHSIRSSYLNLNTQSPNFKKSVTEAISYLVDKLSKQKDFLYNQNPSSEKGEIIPKGNPPYDSLIQNLKALETLARLKQISSQENRLYKKFKEIPHPNSVLITTGNLTQNLSAFTKTNLKNLKKTASAFIKRIFSKKEEFKNFLNLKEPQKSFFIKKLNQIEDLEKEHKNLLEKIKNASSPKKLNKLLAKFILALYHRGLSKTFSNEEHSFPPLVVKEYLSKNNQTLFDVLHERARRLNRLKQKKEEEKITFKFPRVCITKGESPFSQKGSVSQQLNFIIEGIENKINLLPPLASFSSNLSTDRVYKSISEIIHKTKKAIKTNGDFRKKNLDYQYKNYENFSEKTRKKNFHELYNQFYSLKNINQTMRILTEKNPSHLKNAQKKAFYKRAKNLLEIAETNLPNIKDLSKTSLPKDIKKINNKYKTKVFSVKHQIQTLRNLLDPYGRFLKTKVYLGNIKEMINKMIKKLRILEAEKFSDRSLSKSEKNSFRKEINNRIAKLKFLRKEIRNQTTTISDYLKNSSPQKRASRSVLRPPNTSSKNLIALLKKLTHPPASKKPFYPPKNLTKCQSPLHTLPKISLPKVVSCSISTSF